MPLCGGVPLASITCAMMSVVPFAGSAVADAVSVIVEPLGASSGTLSTGDGQQRGSREQDGEGGGATEA